MSQILRFGDSRFHRVRGSIRAGSHRIKIGDYVYSQDVITGEKGFKEVLQLQKRNTCEFVKVKVENEEIEVTPSHLFYTNDQWELAENLKQGDILAAANGEEKKVIAVEKSTWQNNQMGYII